MFAPEQFEECFSDMISQAVKKDSLPVKISKWINGETYTSGYDKLVIVIDNIDRCPKDLAYELVTNTKNFLVPNSKLVFLVPVDDDALKKHIIAGNSENNEKEAEEFLRKIFNITIRIKPFKSFDLFDFASSINKSGQLGFNPTTVDLVAKEFATNPRRIIQFYNNLTTELKIFELKYGADFIRENESVICKCLILREEWSEYYHQITRNTFLLQNPDETTNGIIGKTKSLESFLGKTKSILSSVDIEVIDKILSNSSRNEKLPSDVIKAVEDLEFDKLEAYYTAEPQLLENLVQHLVDKIKLGVDRKTFDTEVVGKFKAVCFLAEKENLIKSDNIKIQNEIQNNLFNIIPKLEDFHQLLIYNNMLVSQRITYLDAFIENILNIARNKEDKSYTLAIRLFSEYLLTEKRLDKIKQYSNLFETVYFENTQTLAEYNIPEDRLPLLLENDIAKKLIEELEEYNTGSRPYNELMYLVQNRKFKPVEIDLVFGRLLNKYPSFNITDKPEIISLLSALSPFLSNHFGVSTETTWDKIRTFVSNVFGVRRSNRLLTNEIESVSESEIVLQFLLQIDMLTKGSVEVKEYVELIVLRFPSLKDNLFSNIKDYSSTFNYPFSSLGIFLFASHPITKNYLEILKHIILHQNEENNYSFPDEQVEPKLNELLILSASAEPVIEIKEMLEGCCTDSRAASILTQKITLLNKEQIVNLSPKLQELAFDKIATQANIFGFLENLEILNAIAEKGNQRHKNALIYVIVTFLQQQPKIEIAFSLISALSEISTTDKKRIRVELERLKEIDTYSQKADELLNSLK